MVDCPIGDGGDDVFGVWMELMDYPVARLRLHYATDWYIGQGVAFCQILKKKKLLNYIIPTYTVGVCSHALILCSLYKCMCNARSSPSLLTVFLLRSCDLIMCRLRFLFVKYAASKLSFIEAYVVGRVINYNYCRKY